MNTLRSQERNASRVLHGKPHPRGGWTVKLDCGHSVHETMAPCVGAVIPCAGCRRQREIEGSGGDAVLDRMVP